MSLNLKRVAIAFPVAWAGGWLTYYGELEMFTRTP